ncbi:DegQ family serine endoprotease [Candidatus Binatia bacterium]|nr:DegQ family serine endoprotease [Candidatus Binatia bacterium]
MNRAKKLVAGTAAAAIVGFGGYALGESHGAGLYAATDGTEAASAVQAAEGSRSAPGALPSFATLAEQVAPSVVFIKSVGVQPTTGHGPGPHAQPFGENGPFPGFPFPMPPGPHGGFKRQGTGSGFIVRDDGLVVTNNHVVEGAKQITVTLKDGTEHEARIVGRDPKTDLAVLKIDPKDKLPAVSLGDSDSLRVGDWVMAIGNPFGLNNTVTAGIVSAKSRSIGAGPYDDFIQTDASINPGNSGGPLFNERGEAVGINTAIFSQSGGNIGIGFAIPINLARALLPELEAHGHVTRGWLGVTIQPVTPDLAKSLDLEKPTGALVADVTADGPAAAAGIKRGDVIVSFGGKKVAESRDLPSLVAATPVGKSVSVGIARGGKEQTVEVAVAKLADDTVAEADAPRGAKWGLALRDLTPEERRRAGLDDDEGVLVTNVAPESPAAEAGVEPGTIVLQVNQTPVGSVEALKAAVARNDGDRLLLLLKQGDHNRFAALTSDGGKG